ncbi:E3 ubiquitin-protein ligase UHRF2 isoform X2 [Sarcophilus harrisii]|uniref:E3 ubiquitin-protein ligase UHRF n=1 Tax=Sarcophilus harrisii TaxID=9305 RepID=A0A7N4NZA4_SARHA|nr:E3 ubiquitin-protein ligase UHRF2 isoform X2 [Sarcophilus harrisii]
MWIQVRTIDGTETRTIDDLSRLTKIETLREKIRELFNVAPERQRLFYRGKQLEDGHTLFDYNVGLNDIVQLLIRSEPDGPSTSIQTKGGEVKPRSKSSSKSKAKKTTNSGFSNQPSTSSCSSLMDPGIGVYKINELVDARDDSLGSWFEANIKSVSPARKQLKSGKAKAKSGKRTNGNLNHDHSRGNTNKLDSAPSTSHSHSVNSEDVVYYIKYDDGPEDTINDCKIQFIEEIYRIEKPGAHPLSFADGPFTRKSGPECKHCNADPNKECRFCSCCLCGGKQDAPKQLLCDECNMAYHIYCLDPPLSKIPEDEDWYCPSCKIDSNEVVKAGEKLKQSKKKAKMPSASTESHRDWGKGMACVGRTTQCTLVPSNHYGPIPGVPVGTTWKFRVQVSEAGVHRPHVGGIHGRSNDGAYSLVLAGGFEDEVDRGDEFTYTGSGGRDLSGNKRIGEHSFDQTLTNMNRALALNCDAPLDNKNGGESKNWRAGKPVRVIRSAKGRRISKYAPEEGNRYDGIYKVVKYWPEIGKCGFLVWRYLLRRDDVEPAPWTAEGIERSKNLRLSVQYPPGYEEAMASKEKKDNVKKPPVVKGSSKRSHEKQKRSIDGQVEPGTGSKTRRMTDGGKVEAFQLTTQQQGLIRQDCPNQKLWDEVLASLKEGPNFLKILEQSFMCVCCQELVYQPVTTECLHNVCKSCLQRSFRAEVFTCPACRHDLGRDYTMVPNKILQTLLDQFFPGYSKGR